MHRSCNVDTVTHFRQYSATRVHVCDIKFPVTDCIELLWLILTYTFLIHHLSCRRNPRASALSFHALQAMSALLCEGPVFSNKVLDRESTLYRWLENMLSSGENRVMTRRHQSCIVLWKIDLIMCCL